MTEVMQWISEFCLGNSIWVYLFIFFGKVLEVSIATLRMVLINRGVRSVGTLLAFFESLIWLIVASSVLAGFSQDFWKGVVYAAAFAAGNYLGSWLDDLLAFGLCSLQAVVPDADSAKNVCEILRAKEFAITSLDVHGRDDDHFMLLMTIRRKRSAEAMDLILSACPNTVISIADIKTQKGAYLKNKSKSVPPRNGK